MPAWAQTVLLLVLGALGAPVSLALLAPLLPRRRNSAGRTVPTAAGIALIPIILLAPVSAATGAIGSTDGGIAFLVYAFVAGVVGLVDDVWGDGGARGFRGHFGALAGGRVTTGLLKLVVLSLGALVFASVAMDGVFRVVFAAVLVAGSAHLANLFDVRPGRAIKFVGLLFVVALPFGASWQEAVAVSPVVGGAVGLFYSDARGRMMLGDAGAAVLGVALGYAVVVGGPGPAWWFYLAVILGLTALAEVSSISKVVERVGFLRRFDSWGRG